MTRAPIIRMTSLKRAMELKKFIDKPESFRLLAAAFNNTSRFGRLTSIKATVNSRQVWLRFKSDTGDAMGMNMVSKGVERALQLLFDYFPDMKVEALSGNLCTDKKASAMNWIEGRGKSVIAECVVTGDVVKSILKTNVKSMVQLNQSKNLIGSALAGTLGGYNAHAANIVAAIFLATGQDPAQVVESASCMTIMEPENDGKDLYVSVNMPSLEVGTVGGGTNLQSQSACLKMLNVKGASDRNPGENAETLAKIIASTVLAGELSLMAALCSGDLVSSHMKLNRVHK